MKQNKIVILISFISTIIILPHFTSAEELKVPVNAISTEGIGESIGQITFTDSEHGLAMKTDLKTLTPGDHGFHLHENPDCGPAMKDGKMAAGQKAGAHYDPEKKGSHKGPNGGGHLGDLPKLTADQKGTVSAAYSVKGIKLNDIRGRAVIIHEGGDNYSDQPAPLGGGGARIACGVILN